MYILSAYIFPPIFSSHPCLKLFMQTFNLNFIEYASSHRWQIVETARSANQLMTKSCLTMHLLLTPWISYPPSILLTMVILNTSMLSFFFRIALHISLLQTSYFPDRVEIYICYNCIVHFWILVIHNMAAIKSVW